MTSLLSVTHRGTGGALAAMLIGGAFGGVLLPMPFPEALALVQVSSFCILFFFADSLFVDRPLKPGFTPVHSSPISVSV